MKKNPITQDMEQQPMPEMAATVSPEIPVSEPTINETPTPGPEIPPEPMPDQAAMPMDAEQPMTVQSGASSSDPIEQAKQIVLKYYPDADVSTPEATLAAASPILIKMDAFNTWFTESLDDSQEAANMLIDIKNGSPWEKAIIENFDLENIKDSPAGRQGIEARKQKVAERQNKVQKWTTNEVETEKNFKEAADELGVDDGFREEMAKNIGTMLSDAGDFLISKQNFINMMNGFRHPVVVAEKEKEKEFAFEDGRIAGRNEKIEKRRATADRGTGLPTLTGTGGTEKDVKKKNSLPTKKEFRV